MSQKPKNLFLDYTSRFFKKTSSVITGILGFIIPFIFEILFPDIFNFYIYLFIIGVSLFVSGYFVYVDVINEYFEASQRYEKDLKELRDQIQEINSSQPKIFVGLQKSGSSYLNKQIILLKSLPAKPQIEKLLIERREELLAKLKNITRRDIVETINLPDIFGGTIASFKRSSQGYEKRVEEYLREYEEYLVTSYEYSIYKDRFHIIKPSVENNSSLLATKVIIEFTLPDDMLFPSSSITEMMEIARMTKSTDLRLPSPPKEPEIFEIKEFSISNWNIKKQKRRSSTPSGLNIIDREGKRVLIFELDTIIQNRPLNLMQIPIWLGDVEYSKTWKIPVKIWAAELRSPIESILEIEINIASE